MLNIGGSCIRYANSSDLKYYCICLPNYDGSNCGVYDICGPLACENGGKCIDLHLNYKCECSNGFYGRNCEIKLSDPCYKNKCVKGKCVPNDFNNGYK